MSDSHTDTDLMSGEPSLPLSRAAEDALPKGMLVKIKVVASLNLCLTSGGVTDSSRLLFLARTNAQMMHRLQVQAASPSHLAASVEVFSVSALISSKF